MNLNKKNILSVIALIFISFLGGCFTQRSITTPISVNFPNNFTQQMVQQTVTNALIYNKWGIINHTAEEITANYNWANGEYKITINITLHKDFCTLKYEDSHNLNYRKSLWSDDDSIHNKFNTIMKKLVDKIKEETNKTYVPNTSDKGKKELDNYIGKPYSELFENFGLPELTYKNDKGGNIYAFTVSSTTVPDQYDTSHSLKSIGTTTFANHNGSSYTTHAKGGKIVHYRLFFVNKDGIIYKWTDYIYNE